MCCSYSTATRLPPRVSRTRASESLRTVKLKLSARKPFAMSVYSVPSHVLQTYPLREIFCTYPARCPELYDQLSTTARYAAHSVSGGS